MRNWKVRLGGAGFALGIALCAGRASAGELMVEGGAAGVGSTWKDDGGAMGQLRVGWRFARIVSVDAFGRLGYAAVDQRMMTGVGLGATGYLPVGPVRPFARIGIVHQHEEPVPAMGGDVFGALVGVGDGIRHRGGVTFGAGFDVPFAKTGAVEWLAGADFGATYFTDVRGPQWYLGGGLHMGFAWSV
jgi:hypothetical protein